MKIKTRYIVQHPEIFSGEPVLAGTRIPAIRLKGLVERGYTEAHLKEDFPHVSRKKIRGALAELMEIGTEKLSKTR